MMGKAVFRMRFGGLAAGMAVGLAFSSGAAVFAQQPAGQYQQQQQQQQPLPGTARYPQSAQQPNWQYQQQQQQPLPGTVRAPQPVQQRPLPGTAGFPQSAQQPVGQYQQQQQPLPGTTRAPQPVQQRRLPGTAGFPQSAQQPVGQYQQPQQPLPGTMRAPQPAQQQPLPGAVRAPEAARQQPLPGAVRTPEPGRQAPPQAVQNARSNYVAVLRGLDKITGRVREFEAPVGQMTKFFRLEIVPRTCYSRPPTETPETSTFLEITDIKLNGRKERIFTGWMFASSPAVNALEHPVYDVWVINCKARAPVKGSSKQATSPTP